MILSFNQDFILRVRVVIEVLFCFQVTFPTWDQWVLFLCWAQQRNYPHKQQHHKINITIMTTQIKLPDSIIPAFPQYYLAKKCNAVLSSVISV